MAEIIYPRSPREVMCGWAHLPRYIDKIRLQLAGRLPPEYEELLGNHAGQERFARRKRAYGLGERDDIQTRADLIDADEGRLP
jgi:hypothetical protein